MVQLEEVWARPCRGIDELAGLRGGNYWLDVAQPWNGGARETDRDLRRRCDHLICDEPGTIIITTADGCDGVSRWWLHATFGPGTGGDGGTDLQQQGQGDKSNAG